MGVMLVYIPFNQDLRHVSSSYSVDMLKSQNENNSTTTQTGRTNKELTTEKETKKNNTKQGIKSQTQPLAMRNIQISHFIRTAKIISMQIKSCINVNIPHISELTMPKEICIVLGCGLSRGSSCHQIFLPKEPFWL